MESATPIPESAARITKAKIDPEGWKEGRRNPNGIGGSDIAKILGCHPTKSQFDCFVEKIGILGEPAGAATDLAKRNPRVRFGAKLEPIVLDCYEEDMEIPIDRFGKVMFRSIEYPWEQVSPDALARNEPRGVEAKTADRDQVKKWGAPGTDDAPEHYYLQAAWGMMVTGMERWDIPVLIGGNDFRIYSIERDPEIESMMREKAAIFWNENVVKGVPPDPIEGALVGAYIRKRFPEHLIAAREATKAEVHAIRDLVMLKRSMAALAEKEEAIQTKLKLAIGEAAGLTSPKAVVTWKKNKDTVTVDWSAVASELFRSLRVGKKRKGEIINRYTKIVPGARPFRPRLIGEEE